MKIEQISRSKVHTVYTTGDSSRVPSVTTILGVLSKPALIPWANRLGLQGIDSSKYVDRLATIGTLAHYWIECYLNNEEPNLDQYSPEEKDLASNSVLKFLEWYDGINPKVIATELRLVSEAHRFGGIVDCICEIEGRGIG